MAGFRVHKIQFISSGFEGILNSSGVEGVVASTARSQAQIQEQRTKVPYAVERMAGATSRVVYVAKPENDDGRVPSLDHETWINEVWPRVGGPAWHPH